MTDDAAGSPLGTEAAQAPTESAPSPIELSEDSLVRLPGAKDPVKYGDYYKGLQSQLTKKSQEAAKLARAQGEYERRVQDAESRMAKYESQLREAQRGSKGAEADPFEEFGQLPYLSGADAVKLAKALEGRTSRFDGALNTRDQVLMVLARELLEMKKSFGAVQSTHANQGFEKKISSFMNEVGIPADPDLVDFTKEIYLAYEGDDLDSEFPDILRKRWEALQKSFRAQEQKARTAARRNPFVPNKGGNGTPGALKAIDPRMSAKQIADEMWPGMGGDGE